MKGKVKKFALILLIFTVAQVAIALNITAEQITQGTNENDFLTVDKNRNGDYTSGQDIIRVTPLSFQNLDSGTNASINSTNKTITDATKTWNYNKHKGYWVGIKFTSGSSTGTISASGKTLTLNAKTTPRNGSCVFTIEASVISRFETSPTSAIFICTSFCFRISDIASNEPNVSVFNIMGILNP